MPWDASMSAITAHSSAGKMADANLYLRGVVIGITRWYPEIIHFYVDTLRLN